MQPDNNQFTASPLPIDPSPYVSSRMAVASFVIGILAFLTGWIYLGAVFGPLAIILGIVSLRKAGPSKRAWAGIILGALGFVASFVLLARLYTPSTSDVSTYSITELADYKTSAIALTYPASWKQGSDGTVALFSDGTETKNGTFIKSRLVYDYDISKLSNTELPKDERQLRADNSQKQVNGMLTEFSYYASCRDAVVISVADFTQAELIGSRVDFSCYMKGDSSKVRAIGIMANDSHGIVHRYTIYATSDAIWKANEAVFEKMVTDFEALPFDAAAPEGSSVNL